MTCEEMALERNPRSSEDIGGLRKSEVMRDEVNASLKPTWLEYFSAIILLNEMGEVAISGCRLPLFAPVSYSRYSRRLAHLALV